MLNDFKTIRWAAEQAISHNRTIINIINKLFDADRAQKSENWNKLRGEIKIEDVVKYQDYEDKFYSPIIE